MNQGEQMNYFQQIIFNSRKNIKLLLKGSLCESLTAVERKILFKRHVEIINLELSYQCNRKCDYCPVEFSNRRSCSYVDNKSIEVDYHKPQQYHEQVYVSLCPCRSSRQSQLPELLSTFLEHLSVLISLRLVNLLE